jgi:hypothetical protein
MKARLVFLSGVEASPSKSVSLFLDSRPLRVGDSVPLELKNPLRWQREDITRVIVGSNPDRADVLLTDEPPTIGGEHARFYLNHATPAASHMRPMRNAVVLLNGNPQQPLAWVHPKHGDEIQLGGWRFRFEILD